MSIGAADRRELAVPFGELKEGLLEGVELSTNNTEAMWLAPMVLLLGAEFAGGDGRSESSVTKAGLRVRFPFHVVKRERWAGQQKVGEGGVEVQAWLDGVVPDEQAEFVEACREMLLARQKPEPGRSSQERQSVDLWGRLRSGLQTVLGGAGVVTPIEGWSQMFAAIGSSETTGYEKMINRLRSMATNERGEFEKMKGRMRELRREVMRKV